MSPCVSRRWRYSPNWRRPLARARRLGFPGVSRFRFQVYVQSFQQAVSRGWRLRRRSLRQSLQLLTEANHESDCHQKTLKVGPCDVWPACDQLHRWRQGHQAISRVHAGWKPRIQGNESQIVLWSSRVAAIVPRRAWPSMGVPRVRVHHN